MLKILTMTALLALGACASGPSSNTYVHAAGDTSFTGWVRFSEGEFQLYADQDQVLQPFSRPCLAGVAPRDIMRMSGDLSNAKVRISGRTAPWSQASRDRIEHAGSVIRNECGGSFVVLADDIRPAS